MIGLIATRRRTPQPESRGALGPVVRPYSTNRPNNSAKRRRRLPNRRKTR
jgi:hypothetical protein